MTAAKFIYTSVHLSANVFPLRKRLALIQIARRLRRHRHCIALLTKIINHRHAHVRVSNEYISIEKKKGGVNVPRR